MSQHKKLVDKLKSGPKNFTWDELKRLLSGFGYKEETGSGSRRKFIRSDNATSTKVAIILHQPHPGNELKAYQVKDVISHLKQEKLI